MAVINEGSRSQVADLFELAGDLAAARGYYEQALALDPSRVGRQAQARLSRLPR